MVHPLSRSEGFGVHGTQISGKGSLCAVASVVISWSYRRCRGTSFRPGVSFSLAGPKVASSTIGFSTYVYITWRYIDAHFFKGAILLGSKNLTAVELAL